MIIKDASGTGSRNIYLAHNASKFNTQIQTAIEDKFDGVLTVEPYINGTLYSVETISWQGTTKIIGVTSRILSAEPQFMELAAATPVQLPTKILGDLSNWIRQILSAVEYTDGFAHSEFIMTNQGFELVEINPRLGGALLGESLCRAYEINIYEAFIQMSLGQRPRLLDINLMVQQGVSQVLIYAKDLGIFKHINGLNFLKDHLGNPEFYPTMNAGTSITQLRDQRSCVGILLASGENTELALLNAIAASNKLDVQITKN